jgi:hypothetical protein
LVLEFHPVILSVSLLLQDPEVGQLRRRKSSALVEAEVVQSLEVVNQPVPPFLTSDPLPQIVPAHVNITKVQYW